MGGRSFEKVYETLDLVAMVRRIPLADLLERTDDEVDAMLRVIQKHEQQKRRPRG